LADISVKTVWPGEGLNIKYLFFATLVSLASVVQPTNASADLSTLVPEGWKLIGQAKDVESAVLIIEKDDPAMRVPNKALGARMLNLNPRRLLFVSHAKNGSAVTRTSDHFLPSEHSKVTPCLTDPLEEGGIGLANGILTIRLNYWLSCGSYGVTRKTFKFRMENRRYRLIGYDVSSFSRSSGMGQETSINYLTGRKKRVTGVAYLEPEPSQPVVPPKQVWERFSEKPHFLDSMDMRNCTDEGSDPASWCDDG
jgi:hypothetical protein